MNPTVIGIIAVILIVSWFLNKREWKKKPREDFVRMLDSRDWRRYRLGIMELRKRGEDVTIYIPRVVSLLVADSKVQRVTGQIIIKDCFPDLLPEIQSYAPMKDLEVCREKAASLLSRYPDVMHAALK